MEEVEELGLKGPEDGQEMGDLIWIGDNFGVPTEEGNQEDVDFYILQCQRIKHVVW